METISSCFETLSTGVARTGVEVPELVRRGLDRCDTEQRRCQHELDLDHRTPALARMAVLYRREARWYRVLADWAYGTKPRTEYQVLGRAIVSAEARALSFAEEYQRFADAAAARRAGGERA